MFAFWAYLSSWEGVLGRCHHLPLGSTTRRGYHHHADSCQHNVIRIVVKPFVTSLSSWQVTRTTHKNIDVIIISRSYVGFRKFYLTIEVSMFLTIRRRQVVTSRKKLWRHVTAIRATERRMKIDRVPLLRKVGTVSRPDPALVRETAPTLFAYLCNLLLLLFSTDRTLPAFAPVICYLTNLLESGD